MVLIGYNWLAWRRVEFSLSRSAEDNTTTVLQKRSTFFPASAKFSKGKTLMQIPPGEFQQAALKTKARENKPKTPKTTMTFLKKKKKQTANKTIPRNCREGEKADMEELP